MLKIGIIGCGKITEVRHAPEYAENPNCQLVAFFDVVPERAKALAEQYGGVAYDSIEALLASDVDAVSVCVANAYHAQASIQALKAGKPVLCEKPMATTPEDCEAMVAAAKAAGKFLMIGQNQRLAKAHVKAREISPAEKWARSSPLRPTSPIPARRAGPGCGIPGSSTRRWLPSGSWRIWACIRRT